MTRKAAMKALLSQIPVESVNSKKKVHEATEVYETTRQFFKPEKLRFKPSFSRTPGLAFPVGEWENPT